MRSAWKLFAAGAILIALGGLAVFAWLRQPTREVVYTDADTIRAARDAAEPRDILWQPPTPLPASINTGRHDYEPRLSWDGLTLFFVRGKAGENADLFVTRRTPHGWTPPEALALNSDADELGPEPAPDGSALYFYSDRDGGSGGYDIWVARVNADGFDPPENLGPAINSAYNDYGPALTPDGTRLYFASNRPLPADTRVPNPDAWPATVREEFLHRTYDLYSASRSERGFAAATPVVETLTPHNEATPCVSPVGDFLYFASDRPEGRGGFDIYRGRRIDGELRDLENLGEPINTPANELDPGLTQLGYGLYFSSDRLGMPAEAPPIEAAAEPVAETVTEGAERPDYNLYFSASREVFAHVEETPPPPIDWAALLPWLLWLLLALLLLATLLALWGALREKRLGLLARCLLASLLAHLLLLLLFSFMHVTEQVMSGLRKSEEIRISLASPQQTSALADQVRPTSSDRPTIEAQAVELAAALRQPLPAAEPELITTPTQAAQPELERVATTPPREARPEAQPTPQTPRVTRADGRPLDMPIPDEVVAESAPETSSDAIAARLETPRLEPSPPRLATSQPVRGPTEIELARAAGDGPDLPAARLPVRESATHAPTSRPAPRANEAVPGDLALDLPSEQAPQVAQADASPPPTPRTERAELEPATPATDRSMPRLAVAIEPIDADAQPFALAASVEPTPREARPTALPTRPRASDRQPARPLELPLALFDESETPEATPVPDAAAPRIAEAVQLAPADVQVTTADARSAPTLAETALPRAATIVPTALSSRPREARTLPSAVARPALPGGAPLMALDLDLPAEVELPAPAPGLAHRRTQRQELLESLGGDEETEAAVARALAWLARHQSSDGGWDGLLFDKGCGGCDGQSEYAIDSALTGLSLLCFLGAGHTHTESGPYQANVARGIRWLLNRQDESGHLGPRETLYSHGIATIALAEAYALTGDSALYGPLQRAVAFIDKAASPRTGGWRYQPNEPADTSVTGWQVMALSSARTAGLAVPQSALASAETWLDRAEVRSGMYAYRVGEPISMTMTAEALFVRQLLGHSGQSRALQRAARFVSTDLPDWDEVDTYRWYYTTLGLFHQQGDRWARWNKALKRELLAHQRSDGPADGSWDVAGPWSDIGGRIYQTALCTLMLETYYRYLPMYVDRPVARGPEDPVGRIDGRVYDRRDGTPLAGARVHLALPDAEPLEVRTDADGRYELDIPQMPEHFAITASHPGYLPRALGAEAAALASGHMQLHFAMEPVGDEVFALEDPPQVHHLGNDRWEGRINSQFQRGAEGRRLVLAFDLPDTFEADLYERAVLTFLAKGVQCPHRVRINGQALDASLEESPGDGSYGEVRIAFPAGRLTAGTNSFDLRSSSCAGDVDDFEFVNVQVRLETE